MLHKKIYSFVSIAIALILSAPTAVKAQTPALAGGVQPVAARLTQPIDEKSLVALKGTVHPLARAANDRGAAPESMQLDRIQIVLKRSDAQETTLKQLISDLHTPGTASYHKWLTPAQFGQQFGPSSTDVATLETWLQSHGFGNFKLNPGQQTLEFSGSAAQFSSTFHTQIHKYVVNGETHYANAAAPQIPAAIVPVFGGFASLNNFRVKSHNKLLGKGTYDAKTDKATPQWTVGSNSSGLSFVLAPADFAVQYDLNPLYTAGTNGNGQTIAIVNDSNINVSLVNNFRTLFGLPANPPQVIIDGNDPGIDGVNNPDGPNGDSLEAYLDVEWSGAVAPGANIDLVIGADTALESGLILAAEHAVYGNVAPVISLSFGECEAALGSGNAFLSNLWEQAAAQGITVAVSTGDSGSAACDNDNTQDYAVNGQAVSGYASTPYNVAVGGTDFYYSSWNQGETAINNQVATYWNLTPSNSTPAVSIKGVIPEQPWNDSQYGLNVGGFTGGETTIAAGSGGASTLGLESSTVAGVFVPYPKPTWQTGTGVPADKARDIPDVSLFASNYANYTSYPVCAVDGDCQPVSGGDEVQFTGVGGTSASTPSFAGIMALINQKYGPQGQADFVLYPLAAQFPAAFHDVVNGTNSVPCNTTTVDGLAPNDCIAVSNPVTDTDPTYGTTVEGEIGTGTTPEYNATVGYDLASGLGTIDANVMVTNWGNVKFASSTTTLTPSSTSFTHGTAITVSGSVTASTTPTGSVALMTNSTEPLQGGETNFTLSNGSYSGSVNYLPGGTYSIWGQYSGDGTNAASTSSKTSITVTPEASSLYFNVLNSATSSTNGTAISAGSSVPYGTQLLLSGEAVSTTYYTTCITAAKPPASCSTTSYGTPTGTVSFSDGGTLLNKAVVNAEGDAEYNAPFAVGSHSVTANYSGDNSYNSSSAAAIAFTVTKDTPALGFSSPSATNAAGTSFQGGEPITFTIQVENFANNTNEQSNGIAFYSPVAAPTGTVTISGLPSGVPTSVTLQAALDTSTIFPEGVGTITAPATTPAGSYTATVSYPGDANYTAATQTFQVVILAANSSLLPSTTTLTSTATTTSPTAEVFVTATVTGQTGKSAPTGTVTFVSSGNLLGSLSLTPNQGTDVSTAVVALNSSISSLLPGANLITVQYSGDSVYQPSSATITITNGTVSQGAASFTLSAPAIAIASQGASGTSTATVAPSNGFTGSVALSCAVTSSPTGAVSTPTCSFSPTSASVTGTASVTSTLTVATTATTTTGTYTFTVTGTSGSITQTTNVTVIVSNSSSTPSFALGGTTPITITSAGASGTSPITITPSAGFTGTVALSCAVTSSPTGATDIPTCSASTPSAITGTATVTATITINTTAAPTGVLNGSIERVLPIGGSITMAAFLFFILPVRRRGLKALLGMLLLAIIGGAAIGCGGGSNSSGGTTTGGGTTAGAYTVTVTGSNSAVTPSPTTTISVTVQ